METIKHDPGMDKPQKTPKELEGMLRAALQEKRGAIVDDFNIRVFRTKAGLPDWDAEILGEKRIVEDDVKDTLVGPFSARTLYTVCKSRLFAAALLDPTERRNFLGSRKG